MWQEKATFHSSSGTTKAQCVQGMKGCWGCWGPKFKGAGGGGKITESGTKRSKLCGSCQRCSPACAEDEVGSMGKVGRTFYFIFLR